MENSEDNQEKSYWFLKFVSEKISKVKSTLLDKLDPGMRLIHQKYKNFHYTRIGVIFK